jgi:hypothetical protein
MKAHDLKRLAMGILLMALLIAPIVSIVLALVGAGFYALTGDQGTALWICGIAFGTAVLFAPIAFQIFSAPPAPPGITVLTAALGSSDEELKETTESTTVETVQEEMTKAGATTSINKEAAVDQLRKALEPSIRERPNAKG